MTVGLAAQSLWRAVVNEELNRRLENPRSKKSFSALADIRDKQKKARAAIESLLVLRKAYGAGNPQSMSDHARVQFDAKTAQQNETIKKAGARIDEIAQSEIADGRSGRYRSIAVQKSPSFIHKSIAVKNSPAFVPRGPMVCLRPYIKETIAAQFDISPRTVERNWASVCEMEASISRDLAEAEAPRDFS